MTPPVIPEMQRLQNDMDNVLCRTDLGEYDKARLHAAAKQVFDLQTTARFYSRSNKASQEQKQISATPLVNKTTPIPVPVNPMAPSSLLTTVPALPTLVPSALTPLPTVQLMSPPKKRKRPRIQLNNYLDDDAQKTYGPFRRSRRNRKESPYKYSWIDDY